MSRGAASCLPDRAGELVLAIAVPRGSTNTSLAWQVNKREPRLPAVSVTFRPAGSALITLLLSERIALFIRSCNGLG